MSELLTVAEVALILKCSEDAVTRRFAGMPGVVDLAQGRKGSRRYRVLRIPKTVLEKYLSTKAGHLVTVQVPPRPERRRKSDNWENIAVGNLAKAGLQNECTDPKIYRRIADRARLLATKIPQELWAELLATPWFDGEEDEYDFD